MHRRASKRASSLEEKMPRMGPEKKKSTNQKMKETAAAIRRLTKLAHGHYGISQDSNAFMTLSFLALPVIPHLKLTTKGLFDVTRFEFVPNDAGA